MRASKSRYVIVTPAERNPTFHGLREKPSRISIDTFYLKPRRREGGREKQRLHTHGRKISPYFFVLFPRRSRKGITHAIEIRSFLSVDASQGHGSLVREFACTACAVSTWRACPPHAWQQAAYTRDARALTRKHRIKCVRNCTREHSRHCRNKHSSRRYFGRICSAYCIFR